MQAVIAVWRGETPDFSAFAAWWARTAAAERGRAILWLPVFMAAGVFLYFAQTTEPALWPPLGVCALATGGAVFSHKFGVARGVLAAIAATALGVLAPLLITARLPPAVVLPSHAVQLVGRVRAVEALPEGSRVVLDPVRLAAGAPPLGRAVRIKLRDDSPLSVGDTVTVRARVLPPAAPAYPGAWDLQRDDFFLRLAGYGLALGPVEILERAPPGGVLAMFAALRATIGARMAAAVPGSSGAIAATLFTGNQAAIPEEDRAAYRDSGLAHILAVAGLHAGIVAGFVLGLVRGGLALSRRAALWLPCKQIAAVCALLAAAAYMMLTGAHVPIVRNVLMASLATLAVLTGRRAVSMRGLAVAATGLILLAPQEVAGVGFQMSFSAVAALIAGYEALRARLSLIARDRTAARRFGRYVAGLILTSALAGTASAPFVAYHFGKFQAWYVLSNMLAVPLTALWVMPLGLVSLLLMPLHLESWVLVPMGWGIDGITAVAHAAAAAPAAVWRVAWMPGWGAALAGLGLAWLCIWRTRWRLWGVPALALGCLSPLAATPPDILVSADARLIGFRTAGGGVIARAPGASNFTRDAFLQAWGVPGADQIGPQGGTLGAAAAAMLVCDDAACRYTARDGSALLLRTATPATCAGADLVLSAEPAYRACPDVKFARAGTPALIDRYTVFRAGGHAVWFTPAGPRIVSDARGQRPWVPPVLSYAEREKRAARWTTPAEPSVRTVPRPGPDETPDATPDATSARTADPAPLMAPDPAPKPTPNPAPKPAPKPAPINTAAAAPPSGPAP